MYVTFLSKTLQEVHFKGSFAYFSLQTNQQAMVQKKKK